MIWSVEHLEDLKAYHSIDVAAQLEAILAEELIRSNLKSNNWNNYTYDYQHLSQYYNNVPIVEENNRKTKQVFSDIDPYGEENWEE